MKPTIRYMISPFKTLWWTSERRGGWKKKAEAPACTEAIKMTKKQAFKCAEEAIRKGADSVVIWQCLMSDRGREVLREYEWSK